MFRPSTRHALAIAAVAGGALMAGTLIPQSATACEPMDGHLVWGFPDDGAVVPPQVEFFALYVGGEDDQDALELVDADGASHDVELSTEPDDDYYAGGLRVSPTEELEPGEYTLTYDLEQEYADTWEVTVVVDESATVGELEDPVDVAWYRQSYGEEVQEMCIPGRGFGSEVHLASIEHTPTPETRYRLIFEDVDGSEFVFNLTADQVADQAIPQWLLHDDVECVSLEVIGVDGEVIDSASACEPEKCVHEEDTETWFSGVKDSAEDWDDVDGCNGADEDDDQEEEDTIDSEESTCASVGSGPTSTLWILIAMVGLVGLRGRRHGQV